MQVRILGPLEVLDDRGRPVAVAGRKEQQLLVALALRANEVVSTEAMSALLWGDHPPRTAPKALQTYVSHLRRVLEAGRVEGGSNRILLTRAGGYELRLPPEAVDLHRFENLVRTGRHAFGNGDLVAASAALHAATRLWRAGAPPDLGETGMAVAERNRLDELRLAAMEDRIEVDLALGRHGDLVGELEVLVQNHSFRERLWGQLMLALYRSGRQGDALRAYQRARNVLVGELGLEPSPPLRALEARMIAQDPALAHAAAIPPGEVRAATVAVAVPLPATLAGAGATPFVGRRRELDVLRQVWEEAAGGAGRAAVVSGDAGIGKTRLAAHLAREVHAGGATVLHGRCDEELFVPFQPFVESIGSYLAVAPEDVVESLLEADGGELSRLLPGLSRTAAARAGLLGDPETERYRLFSAVSSFFRHIASDGPLLVVFDDLHWADRPTLLLLRHVVRAAATAPVLVVGTTRPGPSARDGGLSQILGDLRRDGLLHDVRLGGLDEVEVGELMVAISGHAFSGQARRLARTVAAETDGNPFFVVETVRHLAETGAVVEHGGQWTAPRPGAGALRIPEGVRELVRRRLSCLTSETRRALASAAVVGREFDLALLERLAALSEDALLDVLDEALDAGLVEEVAGAVDRYRFAHSIVRSTLYDGMNGSRRARLHTRAADAIEALYGKALEEHLAEVAHHLLLGPLDAPGQARAGDAARAADYARRAGDAAFAALAYEEAARRYEQALSALDRGRLERGVQRCELLVALGHALVGSGEVGRARETFLDSASEARVAGRSDLVARAALGFVGHDPLHLETSATAGDLLTEALYSLDEHDRETRVQLLSGLTHYQALVAPTEQVRSTSRLALEVARGLESDSAAIAALTARLDALGGPDANEERFNLAAELAAVADRSHAEEAALNALKHRIWSLIERGDALAAYEGTQAYAARAERSRQPLTAWHASHHRVLWAVTDGRLGDAGSLAAATETAGERVVAPEIARAFRVLHTFVIHWLRGSVGDVAPAVRSAIEPFGFLDLRPALLAALAAETGRAKDAARAVAAFDDQVLASVPLNMLWGVTLMALSACSVQLRDEDRAGALYRLLEPYAELNCVLADWVYLGANTLHLGMLAAVAGDLAEAEEHLRQAADRERAFGARPWLAVAEIALGEVLQARGGDRRVSEGRDLLGRGRRVAGALGVRPGPFLGPAR